MSWFVRKPKAKKQVVKVSVWRFRPQEDMTARELALLLTQASPLFETVLLSETKFELDEPPAVLFERQLGMPELARHFEPTGQIIEVAP